MEQVSPQLQFNFQCSRVILALISMLWLLEYVTFKIFWNIWIKLLGIQTWMTLGSNVLIGWTNPYTTSSSSAWKVPIKIDKWCKYMDKFINWLAAWYKIYSNSLCALSLYSLFSPCKAQITFRCKLYFSLQTNSFMSFVYFARNQFIKVFFCQ